MNVVINKVQRSRKMLQVKLKQKTKKHQNPTCVPPDNLLSSEYLNFLISEIRLLESYFVP